MTRKPATSLRRGWTTGACATAATKAALAGLWGQGVPQSVEITLPKGEVARFDIAQVQVGDGWVEAGVIKDAGDDPDVTHGVTVLSRVRAGGTGVRFCAGEGVGTVTKNGLPVPVGEPAINPVPRSMMDQEVAAAAVEFDQPPNVEITLRIPNGDSIAKKTWNPRLGIKGGLSVLGTTGIVRPFSCAAWIASIHRGIDVARADGLAHVAGCTGNTSERIVQGMFDLPDHAMLDMGDFAGGMIKYLRRNPVDHVTIGGGIGKLTKLSQGAVDLHSGRSQVNFDQLADMMDDDRLRNANTALEAYTISGPLFAQHVADRALISAWSMFDAAPPQKLSVVVIDRKGQVIAQSQKAGS